MRLKKITLVIILALLTACTAPLATYHDTEMDFGSIQTVAVMPFANLTGHTRVEDRVRDVFMNMLLATASIYVIPPGRWPAASPGCRWLTARPPRPRIQTILALCDRACLFLQSIYLQSIYLSSYDFFIRVGGW